MKEINRSNFNPRKLISEEIMRRIETFTENLCIFLGFS